MPTDGCIRATLASGCQTVHFASSIARRYVQDTDFTVHISRGSYWFWPGHAFLRTCLKKYALFWKKMPKAMGLRFLWELCLIPMQLIFSGRYNRPKICIDFMSCTAMNFLRFTFHVDRISFRRITLALEYAWKMALEFKPTIIMQKFKIFIIYCCLLTFYLHFL